MVKSQHYACFLFLVIFSSIHNAVVEGWPSRQSSFRSCSSKSKAATDERISTDGYAKRVSVSPSPEPLQRFFHIHPVKDFRKKRQVIHDLVSTSQEACRIGHKAAIMGICILLSFAFEAPPAVALAKEPAFQFELMNGNVQLEETTRVLLPRTGMQHKSTTAEPERLSGDRNSVHELQLSGPQLIGVGGGGAVFAFAKDSTMTSTKDGGVATQSNLLLKVSWDTTSKTVQRECSTLQLLEQNHVDAAERCLGSFSYPFDPSGQRSMILVTPFMKGAVASLSEVKGSQARSHAVDQIARTLVQMVAANVITIDVQPLISPTTGDLIFIDMTEAQVLSSSGVGPAAKEYTTMEQVLLSSFVSEMVALVPEEYWQIAESSLRGELQQRPGALAPRAEALLVEQCPFFPSNVKR